MRVCVLTDGYEPFERGGAQRVAARLAEGYVGRGHEVTAITTAPTLGERGRSVRNGVAVRRVFTPRTDRLLPYLSVCNPYAEMRVGQILDDVAPDVVHAHNLHRLSKRPLRAAADREIPVVKTFHDTGTVTYGELTGFVEDGPPPEPVPAWAYHVDPWEQLREEGLRYNPLRNRINRRHVDRYVDRGVAVSDELRRALAANGVPVDETIRNGIDAAAFAAPAAAEREFRREYGLGDDRIVLFGGRTGYNKGCAHLARAFSRVVDGTDSSVTLLVTGDDASVERMRSLAAPHGDAIRATGWIPDDDLRAAFGAATVVASPSVYLDPFPTVNLEAFAAGTPVVTTRYGGARELVDDGENGRVVDPLDVTALADALRELLGDPSRAAALGRAGRRTVETEFALGDQVDAYLDLFRSLVGGVRERRAPA